MTFLLPAGLFALLALPIIVILHLIQRRRVRQRVPSLELWRELQSVTSERKPRRLPLTLLLLLHLLLATLLAVALAQPLVRIALGRSTHLVLVVDTSTSMAATDGQPDRLADAKRAARDLIATLQRGDSAALIELSAQPAVLAQTTSNDAAVVLDHLDRLQAAGSDGDLDRALALAQATARPRATTRIVVLTDLALQASATHPIAGEVEWRTFGSEGDNTAIAAFAAQPLRNGGHQLYARVANFGATAVARTLTLTLDDQQVASEPVRLGPGAEAEWSWPLPAGAERAVAALSEGDVQPLDDRAVAVLDGAATTQVLLVSDSSITLERALRAQPNLQVQAIAPANYTPRDDVDLQIFVGFVPDQLPATPALFIAPPSDQTLVEVGEQQFSLEANRIDDPRFQVLDWRPLEFRRVSQINVPAWAEVEVAAGDTPLVLTGQRDGQPVMIWAFNPDDTNLANRIQFPLLTAATIQTLLADANASLVVGSHAPTTLQASDGTTIAAGARITQPGFYETRDGALAVNALDATEAQLGSRPAPEITTVPQRTDTAENFGRELWQPLIALAVVVLIAEWLLINRSGGRSRRRARSTT